MSDRNLYTVLIGPALPTLPPHKLAVMSTDELRELCRRCLGYGAGERCPCCGREHWSRIKEREAVEQGTEPPSLEEEMDLAEAEIARCLALCASCFGRGRFGGCVGCGRTAPPRERGHSGRGFRQARLERH